MMQENSGEIIQAPSILVIGGGGFVGSNLVRELSSRYSNQANIWVIDNLSMSGEWPPAIDACSKKVELLKCDASDVEEVRGVLTKCAPDVIFHLAANSDIARSALDSSFDLKSTFGTTSALTLGLEHLASPPSLIFSSTSAVFGRHTGPISAGSPKRPESAYGWMKLASEFLLHQALNAELIRSLKIVRFPNVTGRGQTHGVVRDLVEKYLNTSIPWEILGDGNQTKPYVDVQELVIFLANLASQSEGFEEVNLSPPDQISVREIVSEIEKYFGFERQPVFGLNPEGWVGDIPKYAYEIEDGLSGQFSPSVEAVRRSIAFEAHKYKL